MLLPVEPFRDAYERSGLTPGTIARELGWTRKHCPSGRIVGDSTRVRRALGVASYHPGTRAHTTSRKREYIREATAVALLPILDLDPVDVGL